MSEKMSPGELPKSSHSAAASENDRLARLKSQHKALLEDARERGAKWFNHREEYAKLERVLERLPEDTSTEAIVPLTKKAFMVGHLVHTNEVMVLLGDNWFAERSAKQSSLICQSRLKRCERTVQEIGKEIDLIEGWMEGTRQMTKEEGEVDIREEYDEEAEKRWREEHAKRVRAERRNEKSEIVAGETEQDEETIWRRLEELELEEELDEHLQRQSSLGGGAEESGDDESEHSSDLTESPELTDESSEPTDDEIDEKDGTVGMKRKVSFATIETSPSEGKNEPLSLIEVIHSDSKPIEENFESPPTDTSSMSPADLAHFSGAGKVASRRRSILKPFAASEIRVREDAEDTAVSEPDAAFNKEIREPFVNPIDDRIIERVVTTALSQTASEEDLASAEAPRKISKFKQSRVKK